MTPAARYSASITVLDQILADQPAEKCLTNWARRNRYAGSGDRAAIRDIVYDILRKKRSCEALGGGATGRALVIGYLRQTNQDVAAVFTGEGYAPEELRPDEIEPVPKIENMTDAVRLDFPDWLEEQLQKSLKEDHLHIMEIMRERAPLFLRVNPTKCTIKEAAQSLATDEIDCKPHGLAPFCLEVTKNPRRVATSTAYQSGLVEIQDAASQAVIAALELPQHGKVLDYCAGGGGKSLAMASTSSAQYFAHDAIAARLVDLPKRAKRAGADIRIVTGKNLQKQAPFDLVLCDVPCSGSGAWRRNPAAKWDLTSEKLAGLCALQQDILRKAAELVATDGTLSYATCSLLAIENQDQINDFFRHDGRFTLMNTRFFSPLEGGDGLFVASLKRTS